MCLKLSGGDGPNSKEMCASSNDLLPRPAFPTSHEEALFFKDNMGTGSVWLGMELGPMSNWQVASDVQKYNDPYPVESNESLIDLRRFGSWQENLVGTNDASKGCLSFANNGLIQPEFGASCDEARPPACEYRSCLTKRGLSCVFPFKYFNFTEDGTKSEITYHYCASLDIFSPWCATVVSATGEVIEWDECVSDCPHEPPEMVCEMDPPTPTIVSVLGATTNFSTTHEFGVDTVVSELDFVEYHCPEGYYFNGTNRLTVRAFCKNWQWEVDFDPETVCIPVLCTCPQWFPPKSKLGTYNWNNGLPPPTGCNQNEPNVKHLTEVTYNCPDGFMFNTSESDVAIPESATLTFTCSKFANWSPVFQPHCIPRNCVNDPPLINRTARDWMDWDLNIRNRSYTHSINYTCPLKNWGYPSSGENRMVATCQENLRWNLTSVEKCVALPCPSRPPSAPIGGRRWYGLQQTKYSCPPGYKFADGSYPFFHANCSAAKQWQPPNFLPQCVPRQCSNDPPLHFLGQDLDWSFRSKTLGTKVTYTCPFFKVTQQAGLSVQHSQCTYDKDTDELHWYPPSIQDCTRKSLKIIIFKTCS
ncbi:uncharacterized protein LOC131885347 [Tigriopus californicus]|uniref:uncharacterized protein LOC131885347 n=1 Tax=Tigriopus californicus TaxID=6832 RepID=UPI0027DA5B60|nr:uncharacterized protein LOC131885347 [Tigriopus californicus]